MRTPILIATIAVVFLAGLAVGFLAGSGNRTPEAKPMASTDPVDLERREPTGPETQPGQQERESAPETSRPETAPGDRKTRRSPVLAGSPAVGGRSPFAEPAAPPPLSREARAEAERIRRTDPARTDGNGEVTSLLDPFESDREKKAFEEIRKKRWETRLRREIDIKIRALRDSIGLTNAQATALREILDADLETRNRLVEAFAAKEISGATFDEKVAKHLSQAREKLQKLLTDEQYAAYVKLKPKEQVLRNETK